MSVSEHQAALAPVADALREHGFYAYGSFDDQNRWCVACDLEAGHIDIRIGMDGYELDAWATLTGMYVDEENQRRRHALERLARVSIPALERGFLDETQKLTWDEVEHGISLRKTVSLPFHVTQRIPEIAVDQLNDVNATLLFLERQINQ